MFEWRDPFSVSTRGRPSCGAECLQDRHVSEQFVLHGLVQRFELRPEVSIKCDAPGHVRLWL
jgi:hypothetical protein